MAACDSVVDSPAPAPTAPRSRAAATVLPVEPKLEVRTPTYPASVMYIVYREYAHLHPETRTVSIETDKNFQKYVEKRLRKLYPAKGYDGMMADMMAEAGQHRAQWAAYERDLRRAGGGDGPVGILSCDSEELQPVDEPTQEKSESLCPGGGGGGYGGGISGGGLEPAPDQSWTGSTEYQISDTYIPTVQEYVDSLQTEGDETETLYYYESLADPNNTWVQPASAGRAASRDDLIRATATQGIGGAGEVSTQGIIPAVWGVSGAIIHCAIHVLLARHRAYGKQADYYPGLAGGDDRADAFRHIVRQHVSSALLLVVRLGAGDDQLRGARQQLAPQQQDGLPQQLRGARSKVRVLPRPLVLGPLGLEGVEPQGSRLRERAGLHGGDVRQRSVLPAVGFGQRQQRAGGR
jgi:hypothetical protein